MFYYSIYYLFISIFMDLFIIILGFFLYIMCYVPATIDGSTARRCTAIVTNQHARLCQSVLKIIWSESFKNTGSADITAHPRKLQHRHYYFNR